MWDVDVDFEDNIIQIFKDTNDWFKANLLTLNFDKTYFIQFLTKNRYTMDIHIVYCNNQIAEATNTKFLGLIIDNMLSWKGHVDWIISKLSSACYAIRAIKPHMSQETLKMISLSYFHSVMSYCIIFWGSSPLGILIFRIQKRVIRIITDSRSHDSFWQLLKKLKILPLQSQYIFSLLLFMTKNSEQFKSNSQIHSINTRHNNNLHYATCNLTAFQKGTHYLGIKVFNSLPLSIKNSL
jgi:hypothetical protein